MARLEGRKYSHIIDKPYRWDTWAAPKDRSGKLDHNHALTGDDLLDFVNRQLFPYLQGFKAKASGPNTIEYKIGEIFSEIKNRIQSGYNLRDIIEPIDELRFLSQTEKHELSHLYEAKIKNMGNAGRNGGEYYTPRPLIRAGIVIKNTFLSNTDNASVSLRKLLLQTCNLHSVLDCPGGTFQGAGVKTVVLFFEKGAPTRKVWFYQLDPGRNMGKTNPLNDADLADFIDRQKTFADSPKSWSVDVKDIDPKTCDLSVKNPDGGEVIDHLSPAEIMREITELDKESAEVLKSIKRLLSKAEGALL
jgi:type I restriction-modification system DNA methylase subunit